MTFEINKRKFYIPSWFCNSVDSSQLRLSSAHLQVGCLLVIEVHLILSAPLAAAVVSLAVSAFVRFLG